MRLLFFIFSFALVPSVFAAPPLANITSYCTGGEAYAYNEIYFTLTPSADSEIDIHNAQADRMGIFAPGGKKTHYWLNGRYDATGTGYVTVDSTVNLASFGLADFSCRQRFMTPETWSGFQVGFLGGDKLVLNNDWRLWQDFFFYSVILPIFLVVFGWWAFRGFFKLFFR